MCTLEAMCVPCRERRHRLRRADLITRWTRDLADGDLDLMDRGGRVTTQEVLLRTEAHNAEVRAQRRKSASPK